MLASSPDAVRVPLHAENNPEMVHYRQGTAQAEARQFPAGYRCRLGSQRNVNANGKQFSAASVASMLGA